MSLSHVDMIIADIKNDLREHGEYVVDIYDDTPHFDEAVAAIRSWGRRAGRELGWKIMTTTRRIRDEDVTRIWVILKQSNPVHQAMLQRRGEDQLIEAINAIAEKVFPDGPPPPFSR
jgi:hypothetical protein